MSQRNHLAFIDPATAAKPMLIGGSIALILIAIFLSGTGEPNPEWGKFWMARPLIIVPLAGATGGLFYHIATHRFQGWKKSLAIAVSFVVYIAGVWIGTVLGLDSTYWN